MSVFERPEDYPVEAPIGNYTHLEPFSVFETLNPESKKTPLIILNTPLQKLDLRALWSHSSVRICADGGANRLYDYFESDAEREKYIPTYITGDCDSIIDSVNEYYLIRGAIEIPQYSQYSSDFMKSVKVALLYTTEVGRKALKNEIEEVDGLSGLVQKLILESTEAKKPITVRVAGGIGGRFDQTIQSINQMYALKEEFPWLQLVFFSPQDVIFLAPKGVTYVSYSTRTVFNTKEKVPKCGLLPFGKKTSISSKGLLYDVENWPSEIGHNVSSSNGVCGTDGFIVESTEHIVINVEVSREFTH